MANGLKRIFGKLDKELHRKLMFSLGHLFAALGDSALLDDAPAISGVVIDSRKAQPSNLFVAFEGEQADGHDFVAHAFENGAIAAMVQKKIEGDFNWYQAGIMPALPCCILVENSETALQQIAHYWRNQFDPQVVAITGSVGKTSTKELTAAVLGQRHRVLKSRGNYNNEIGLPLTILELTDDHDFMALEMGAYQPGEIESLCRIAQPDIGVVTIVSPAHLERMGSLEAIQATKQELVEALPASGSAILNYDEPLVMQMANHTTASVFTYGLNPEADLWADEIGSMGLDGIHFKMRHQDASLHVHVPLLGRHSVHTALRASAVGIRAGMEWDDIISGLQDKQAQLRLVAVEGPNGSLIIDDTYNSSPESALAALNLLHDLDGRRIAVMGDMLELGAAEQESHLLVGRRIAAVADILVTVGVRAQWFGQAAEELGMPASAIYALENADQAINLLEKTIEPADVTLIKGSLGMRLDRIVTALSQD